MPAGATETPPERRRRAVCQDLEYSLADRSHAARREREALVGSPDALPAGWQIAAPVPVEEPVTSRKVSNATGR